MCNKSNKFLELYPQLWVPKLGDKVRVCSSIDSKYANTTGKITYITQTSPLEYMIRDSHDCLQLQFFHKEEMELIHE